MRNTLLKHGLLLMLVLISVSVGVFPQRKNSSHGRATMSPEARALVEEASAVVCTQAKLDPKSSVAIDEMKRVRRCRSSIRMHKLVRSARRNSCRSRKRW